MTVYNEYVRMFLLKKGFNAVTPNGNQYTLIYCDKHINIKFDVLLDVRKAFATYPDKVYNAQNTYSPRDCKVEFDWNIDDVSDTIITNLNAFFDKIIDINS